MVKKNNIILDSDFVCILIYNNNLNIYLFRYINCNAFGTVSEDLAKHLAITLKSDKPAEKLTEFRYLWVDLSLMMQQLGKPMMIISL